MAKKSEKEVPELDIEKPVLDLKSSERDLPEKVPDVFNTESEEGDESVIEPLIRDVEILLAIGDIDGAKVLYRRLRKIHDSLTREQQDNYFGKVEKLYKQIEDFRPAGSKMKRLFSKK